MLPQSPEHIASCLARGSAIARLMEESAVERGASEFEAEKARNIAERVFAVIVWMADAEETRRTADAFASACVLGRFGIAVSVLNRSDIPMRIRQALLPVLRPDARAVSVDWWDQVAIPQWVEPFLHDIDSAGQFDELSIASQTPGAYDGHPSEREQMDERLAAFKARHCVGADSDGA